MSSAFTRVVEFSNFLRQNTIPFCGFIAFRFSARYSMGRSSLLAVVNNAAMIMRLPTRRLALIALRTWGRELATVFLALYPSIQGLREVGLLVIPSCPPKTFISSCFLLSDNVAVLSCEEGLSSGRTGVAWERGALAQPMQGRRQVDRAQPLRDMGLSSVVWQAPASPGVTGSPLSREKHSENWWCDPGTYREGAFGIPGSVQL